MKHSPEPVRFLIQQKDPLRCGGCVHRCTFEREGDTGACGVRVRKEDTLWLTSYGEVHHLSVEPIAKKGFAHVLPGELTLSYGGRGWIQPHLAKQEDPHPRVLTPEALLNAAGDLEIRAVVHDFDDPLAYLEFAMDVAKAARERGLLNLWITSGLWTEMVREILPDTVHAVKIRAVGFSATQRERLTGTPERVEFQDLAWLRRHGVWVEVGIPVIPGETDHLQDIQDFCRALAMVVGEDVPLHVERVFSPDGQRTPVALLNRVADTASRILRYVYVDHLPGNDYEITRCPVCDAPLVYRFGWTLIENRLQDGRCPECRTEVPGLWQVP